MWVDVRLNPAAVDGDNIGGVQGGRLKRPSYWGMV